MCWGRVAWALEPLAVFSLEDWGAGPQGQGRGTGTVQKVGASNVGMGGTPSLGWANRVKIGELQLVGCRVLLEITFQQNA